MDFEALEQASLYHSIYDADQFDPNPLWYRESLNTGYKFRLGPRDPELPQPSCWIDQDQSGDYDPSAKRLQQQVVPPKRKREPAPPELDGNGQPIPRKPRQVTWQFGRFNGLSLPVTLKLTSNRGLHLLAQGIDNWPADDEPESSTHSHGSISIFTSPSADTSNTSLESYADPYTFRPRDKACYDEHDQGDVDDDIDLSQITLGHPAARGCIPCLKLRLPCPLIQEGPATGRTRTGPSLDQADPIKSLKLSSRIPLGRRFVNCTQCRQAKKWCSLHAGQEGPCNRCKTSNIDCTFESLRSILKNGKLHLEVAPSKGKGKAPIDTSSHPQQPIFDDSFADLTSDPFTSDPFTLDPFTSDPFLTTPLPPTTTKTITTRFPHPITFNYIPPSEPDTPHCHWCDSPHYGLLGLGTVEVSVMSIGSNAGYTELDGGHTAQGHLPARMCAACTFERFQIFGCEGHELVGLEGMDVESFDQGQVFEFLAGEGPAAEGPEGEIGWEWCSVCPNAAFYGCCRLSSVCLSDSGEDSESVGCGLRLCEECAILLTECGGDLGEAIWRKREEAATAGNEFAVRADAEFLTMGGELVRRIAVAGEDAAL
ncbi:MAG: hypothetical protein Q9166_000279 [cf. Caloplaca sp. 2 TL-2023]